MAVRLDSSLQYDRLISERLHEAQFNNPSFNKTLAQWLNKGPKVKLTRSLVKVRIASYLSMVSEYFPKINHAPTLTAPELMALFDAYAKDTGIGEIDPDLAEYSPEAFSKAIQRGRGFWHILPNPDKK